MNGLLCDFCSKPEPTWRYPSSDFIASETEGPGGILVQESIGGWAACDDCHALIAANDWKGLAARSADSLLTQCPFIDRDWLLDEMIQTHQRFATARKGPAERI